MKLKKLLHNKGNYKQGVKTAFRMGEIIANEETKGKSQKYTSNSCSSIPEKEMTQSKNGPKI